MSGPTALVPTAQLHVLNVRAAGHCQATGAHRRGNTLVELTAALATQPE